VCPCPDANSISGGQEWSEARTSSYQSVISQPSLRSSSRGRQQDKPIDDGRGGVGLKGGDALLEVGVRERRKNGVGPAHLSSPCRRVAGRFVESALDLDGFWHLEPGTGEKGGSGRS
jgi:hypothetical protein